jgi:hypothetical protein
MEISILIAKIIGIIYLSFGVGLLFNQQFYKNEIPKLLANTAYLILGGFLAIIIGSVIIENHNFWVKNWTVVITIIGWIALIKGIVLIAFPTKMTIYKPLFENKSFFKILIPCIIIFGLIFIYFGFFSN